MREAQVLTLADAFAVITLSFLLVVLLVPLLKKVGASSQPVADAP